MLILCSTGYFAVFFDIKSGYHLSPGTEKSDSASKIPQPALLLVYGYADQWLRSMTFVFNNHPRWAGLCPATESMRISDFYWHLKSNHFFLYGKTLNLNYGPCFQKWDFQTDFKVLEANFWWELQWPSKSSKQFGKLSLLLIHCMRYSRQEWSLQWLETNQIRVDFCRSYSWSLGPNSCF